MAVNVDGIQVLSAAVSERTFADYSADVGIPEGSHTISVSFVNDYSAGCDRNLRVDKVTVRP